MSWMRILLLLAWNSRNSFIRLTALCLYQMVAEICDK